ncbi:GNAT family N-acetyltransferase [Youngiibacter fragilis]|uniref:BioF2-like acetyltransferase domain-containing protein n=1 Tax=Youngiibacter fragilis 232.1 TaxID=994573 RepID=V7I5K4_9CLOT|nr:GNAT family N-acetyltransferase [Youngiibacter fragilis]ETA81133.1 hypothetical protein T472_0208215 [Youngiibacter fragilis 232.1]
MRSFAKVNELKAWILSQGAETNIRLRMLLEKNEDIFELLQVLEEANPCGQEYFVVFDSIIVTYRLKLNLLTFMKRSLKADARIIGLPISLSRSGIISHDEVTGRKAALEVIRMQKGLTVALNSDYSLGGSSLTLSNFLFINRFRDFDGYLMSMRSSYRRNLLGVLEEGKGLVFRRIDHTSFSSGHHELYRNVVERSLYPLETLPVEFFRNYPSEVVEVIGKDGRPAAVLVLKGYGDTLTFMFCGFRREEGASLYHNLLVYVIRKGIEEGYQRIDMGQTSEAAKLRLGCTEETKHMLVHHGNPVADAFLRLVSGKFSYRRYKVEHRVFRS